MHILIFLIFLSVLIFVLIFVLLLCLDVPDEFAHAAV